MKLFPNGMRPLLQERAPEFLSCRFETLVAELARLGEQLNSPNSSSNRVDFDVIVVGSGYGGAVAASQFSSMQLPGQNTPPSVCVLERGIERLAGSFPDSLSELPNEVRLYSQENQDVRGNRSGLFDVRIGKGCSALIANGLGGGSLINAGVMLKPAESVFSESVWPKSIRTDESLSATFDESLEMVGATYDADGRKDNNKPITTAMLPKKLSKFEALERLGVGECTATPVPITVKLSDKISDQTIATQRCIQCGDCFSGCNYNAKRSLDTNLLAKAAINGARLFCGATVLSFDKLGSELWELTCTYTDTTMQKHLAEPVKLRCRKLIIAAGSLGSTELLLRSQEHSSTGLLFSAHLGERFSGNGDMIVTISDCDKTIKAVANEAIAPSERGVGPTITGMLDLRKSSTPVIIQELGVPAILRRLLIQTTAFTQTIGAITQPTKGWARFSERIATLNPLGRVGPGDSAPPASVFSMADPECDRLSILALIGDDQMHGRLLLSQQTTESNHTAQGCLDINFPVPNVDSTSAITGANAAVAHPSFYERNMKRIQDLLARNDPTAWLHANPLWKPLGIALESLFDVKAQGMQITVHPLGGCTMGESHRSGVVDDCGRAFNPRSQSNSGVHEGLVILDGSIIPKALGVNPALTITALALRATRQLAKSWNWEANTDLRGEAQIPPALPRPSLRHLSPDSVSEKRQTKVEIVERLIGSVTLYTPDGLLPCVVELRLRSSAFNIVAFTRFIKRSIRLLSVPIADLNGSLPDCSYIRIFSKEDWDRHHEINSILREREADINWATQKRHFMEHYDQVLDELALVSAPVTGHIRLLEEEPLLFIRRLYTGAFAWLLNRGLRDLRQSLKENTEVSLLSRLSGLLKYFNGASLAAFAHSGRERRLSYHLVIGEARTKGLLADVEFTGRHIDGIKRFAYRRRSNPWRQLMEIQLSNFPHLSRVHARTLKVDPAFFSRTQVPLLHIVDEDNAVDGTADLLDFYAHMARVFVLQQLWAFRKPDTAINPQIVTNTVTVNSRLPTDLAGLSRFTFPLNIKDTLPDLPNKPVTQAQLTRYRSTHRRDCPPVLCIHGYSASGSTFAHPALYGGEGKTGGLTRYLCEKGHDVWVLDMRSSSAFECARMPWDFEHMSYNDIPVAVNFILKVTGAEKVDIVAHCMGAVMLSMALVGETDDMEEKSALATMRSSIGRIVLSQAGPFLQFTPINTMRAWLLGFFKQLLPREGYEFNPQNPLGEWETILDRLLNTLPYPDNSEFDRENPRRGYAYWVRTRHRMDALYGKTFSLSSMSDDILNHIDDFFGPFSFQTLEQTLSIAKRRQISSRFGNDFDLTSDELARRWGFPTLWIHGEDNGLIDPVSPSLTAMRFDEAGNHHLQIKIISKTGHQDCLMARDSEQSFNAIAQHLERAGPTSNQSNRQVYRPAIVHPVLLERCEPNSSDRWIIVRREDPSFNKLRRLALLPLLSDNTLPSTSVHTILIDAGENGSFKLPAAGVPSPSLVLLLVSAPQSRECDRVMLQDWLTNSSSHQQTEFQIIR